MNIVIRHRIINIKLPHVTKESSREYGGNFPLVLWLVSPFEELHCKSLLGHLSKAI